MRNPAARTRERQGMHPEVSEDMRLARESLARAETVNEAPCGLVPNLSCEIRFFIVVNMMYLNDN